MEQQVSAASLRPVIAVRILCCKMTFIPTTTQPSFLQRHAMIDKHFAATQRIKLLFLIASDNLETFFDYIYHRNKTLE